MYLLNQFNHCYSSIMNKNLKVTKERNSNNIARENIKATHLHNVSFYGVNTTKVPTLLERYEGCLLGGALGDAFGASMEFLSLAQIKKKFGKLNKQELQVCYNTGTAEITDDTQMTMFTVDGLIKGLPQKFSSSKLPVMSCIYNSYLDWFRTQTSPYEYNNKNGWLSGIEELYVQKDPGNSCMNALSSGKIGDISTPINNSKGNGCVMRVAPIGLVYKSNPLLAFEVGARSAAYTHGHSTALASTGFMATLISFISSGYGIQEAIDKSLIILNKQTLISDTNELKSKIMQVLELANDNNITQENAIKKIGSGWTAEEALGIALYSVLKSENDFKTCIQCATNHSGDSDTVGAIAGNIIGTILGANNLPAEWCAKIQFHQTLKKLARDLYTKVFSTDNLSKEYPFYQNKFPAWYSHREETTSRDSLKFKKVNYSTDDIKSMEAMTLQERIIYKKKLLNEKKYLL